MVDTQKYDSLLEKNYVKELGRVTRVVGLTIESQGPDVVLEDMCVVTSKDHTVTALCEVIGFKDESSTIIVSFPVGLLLVSKGSL